MGVGHWRAFLYRRAPWFGSRSSRGTGAPQSASHQIQALEDRWASLFLRHTRAVELTSAGAQLLRTVGPAIERMDAAVRLVRQTAGRKRGNITTWSSFASMWLIPRMEAFQQAQDIDIRIDASDSHRPGHRRPGPGAALQRARPRVHGGERLFGEQLAVVAGPGC